jgi:hypothetical protein
MGFFIVRKSVAYIDICFEIAFLKQDFNDTF